MHRNNYFGYLSWYIYNDIQLTVRREEEFIQWLTTTRSAESLNKLPFAMDRHMYFIDTKIYNLEKGLEPTWINMVRDPVERFVSNFHWERSEYLWSLHSWLLQPPQEWFDKDINTCIISGDSECQFNPESKYLKEHQLTYFCGSSPECKHVGSMAALHKAKYNAEMYYSVIGIQNDIQTTLEVLEGYIPLFFKGARKEYNKMGIKQRADDGKVTVIRSSEFVNNDTPRKQNLSELARSILLTNMTLEYEFFEFVKLRLNLQARRLRGHVFHRTDIFENQ